MEATKENKEIVISIIKTLNQYNCSIKRTEEILSYVRQCVKNTSSVSSINDDYFGF